jgi:hypothetical protein
LQNRLAQICAEDRGEAWIAMDEDQLMNNSLIRVSGRMPKDFLLNQVCLRS